jgi:16S rRNA (guanine1516-N2)-methyltransferase
MAHDFLSSPLLIPNFSVVFKELPCYSLHMISDANKPIISAAISFLTDDTVLRQQAENLATKMQLPIIQNPKENPPEILLLYNQNGLELHYHKTIHGKLHIDFQAASLLYRKRHGGGTKQALARAVGVKANTRPTILDATAGLGIDSHLLASFGCKVRMIERSPFLAVLLEDALERIQASNPHLLHGEAVTLIAASENIVDTIYFDPMYPHRNKSALNKQEMRIIRELVGDDNDANKVFRAAMEHAQNRVVVKRPKGAPQLCEQRPSHVIKMKNSRFDVYMV